ncbi:hypothetical protein QJQ45_009446 [Haematococcus lacustris]|nr:hypothetical protein QJQ45_009446 [Haematococcus lacustris]
MEGHYIEGPENSKVASRWDALLPDPRRQKLASPKHRFDQVVHTDGVAISVMFLRPKPAAPPAELPRMAKGMGAVPVSQMRKEAVKQFRPERVVLVDEFRTSRVSSADNTPSETLLDTPPESFRWLRPVKSKAKRSQVRGLMCLTSINNITRFYDRDVSAALNIRRCAVGPGPRPTELCYWINRPAMPKPGQPGQEWVEIADKPLLLKWQRQLQQ